MEDSKNTDFIFRNLDFGWAFNRVIEWNSLARNGKHVYEPTAIISQKKLVKEETDEFETAIEEHDKKEALDGLCDMFVVGAYWYFLQNKDMKHTGYLASTPLENIDYVKAARFDLENDSSAMFMLSVTSMLLKFEGNVRGALEEVLSSNDSKFPFVRDSDALASPEDTCRWIEDQSSGRYTGVKYNIIGKGKEKRYVFLDSNGKIMKPKSFFKPDLSKFV